MYVFTSSPRDRACTARSAAGSDRHQQRDKCLQNSFKAVVLLGVLSIATQPVRGADMSALSWDECVAEASANNSELLAARAGVEAAGHSHSKARGQLRPKLSAYGTYDRIDGDIGGSGETGNSSYERRDYGVGIRLERSFSTGGRNKAAVRRQGALAQAEEASYADTCTAVSYELRIAFTELLYAQESEELATEILNRRTENLELVSLRFDGGREHKGSYLLSKALFQEAETQHTQAVRSISVARERLASVLGRKQPDGLQVQGTLAGKESTTRQGNHQSLTEHPAYRTALANLEYAEADVKVARSEFFPDIAVSSSFGRSGEDSSLEDEEWRVGVTLTVPLFEGFSNRHGLSESKARRVEAQHSRQSTFDKLTVALSEKANAFRSASEDLLVRQKLMEAALVRAEIARAQYDNGLMPFESWDIIENDLIARQKQHLEAERQFAQTEAAWRLALGEGDIEP
jgi:outer membrane protein TolC